VSAHGGAKRFRARSDGRALVLGKHHQKRQPAFAQVQRAQALVPIVNKAVKGVALVGIAPALLDLIIGLRKIADGLATRIRAAQHRTQLLLRRGDVYGSVKQLFLHKYTSQRLSLSIAYLP